MSSAQCLWQKASKTFTFIRHLSAGTRLALLALPRGVRVRRDSGSRPLEVEETNCCFEPELRESFRWPGAAGRRDWVRKGAGRVKSLLKKTQICIVGECFVLRAEISFVCCKFWTVLCESGIRTKKALPCRPSRRYPFALTRQACLLLERLAGCVHCAEPALLVGETGCGKTACVQRLAAALGRKLRVINMNQQSDTADLLGG